jgi:predicted nucleotidyltransferase component of viral defense system
VKNEAASIRAKLLNLSRAKGMAFNALMEQYATGRFLYRLAQSPYRERFVLKGAQLFRVWEAEAHRPTRDLDLLGYGNASEEVIQRIFTEVTQAEVEPPDGLEWGDVSVTMIRDEQRYGGIRARVSVLLAGARLSIQIDVGFGDAITPEAVEEEWRELLPFPSARLLVYPPETVIAEKLEAVVSLGINNSRMKDFYDLTWLHAHLPFEGSVLTQAVVNTFERRETEFPNKIPIAFTEKFYQDERKLVQWNAFLRKGRLTPMPLEDVVLGLSQFLLPVLRREVTDCEWTPAGKWQTQQPTS